MNKYTVTLCRVSVVTLALFISILLTVLVTAPSFGQSDEEAIRQLIADNITAYVAGDIDGLVAMYTDDVLQMPPFAESRQGIDAVRANAEEGQAANSFQSDVTVQSVHIEGDRAWVVAHYEDVATPKSGGDTAHWIGNWILLLRRTEDGWKVYQEIWNYEHPPGQAPTG